MPTASARHGSGGNGASKVSAKGIDAQLHRERLDRGRKRLHALPGPLAGLPDGAMVQQGEQSFLMVKGGLLLWSPAGYARIERELEGPMLLTPPSILRAFSAGYQPVLHPSALS